MRLFACVGFAVFVLAGAAVGGAEACSCAGVGSPCQSLWSSSAVFVGQVTEIVDVDPPRDPPRDLIPLNDRRVRLLVLEVFAGITATEVDVYTARSGAACGYRFDRGGRYLVYAHASPDGSLRVSLCSRTSPAGWKGDLAYLRSLKASPPATGRILGQAKYWERRTGGGISNRGPFAGARVVATGDAGTFETVTDRDGKFELPVSFGTYALQAVVKEGFYADIWPRQVHIRDAQVCGAVKVSVHADGR